MYKIAIVGAGAVAGNHAKAILQQDNARLCAISDPLPEKGEALSKLYGGNVYTELEAMLDAEAPDVVILSLPTFLHAEYVERCASRGIHILCEKPIGMSLEDAKTIAASKIKHGVRLMVGQVVRFWPGYVDIKRLLDSGELGDVMMAYFSRASMVPARGGWILDPDKGRGAIQDMHIHDVDFLCYLFGDADRVYSHAARDDTGCFDHAISSITFKNGVKAVASAAFTLKDNSYPFSTSFRVSGTNMTIEYRYRAAVLDIRAGAAAEMMICRKGQPVETFHVEEFDPYASQLNHFLSCVASGKDSQIVPIQDSLSSISLLDAIRASAESEQVENVIPV